MATGKSIVISGDLGSGKSTVSMELAARLGVRRISIGDLYRQMAESRGMSALQLNLHAELDDDVDGYVDQLQAEIAKTDEQLVVDGRLAWFFFTDSFKVHLIVDPAVAAARVLARPSSEVEAYSSVQQASERLKHRSDSERLRYLTRYGADKNRLRNYDLVCDSTAASPDEVAQAIITAYRELDSLPAEGPLLQLDPGRIYPTREQDPAGEAGPVQAGYAGSTFFVLRGHAQLSAAIRAGQHLIAAHLRAEDGEPAGDGLTSVEYFERRVTPAVVHRWQAEHGITLPPPVIT